MSSPRIVRALTAELAGDAPLPRRIVEAHVLVSLLERATDELILSVVRPIARGRPAPPAPSSGPALAPPAAVPLLARSSRAVGRIRRLAARGADGAVLQVLAEAVTIVGLPSLLGDATLQVRAATLLFPRPMTVAPSPAAPTLSPPGPAVADT